jgi:GAF domain-containing protein
MPELTFHPLQALDEDVALRTILEGTATETGERFFAALVENLSKALGTYGAWVTEYQPATRKLRALAFRLGDEWVDGWEMVVDGTPCETVIKTVGLVHYPENVVALYPDDPELQRLGAVSYMGVPLLDDDRRILGNLAVLDTRPMPAEPRALAVFRIFADRAAAELRRLRAEAEVRERDDKLSRLVDSAMDAIVELDRDLRVSRANPAAFWLLGCVGLVFFWLCGLRTRGEGLRTIPGARKRPHACPRHAGTGRSPRGSPMLVDSGRTTGDARRRHVVPR